MCKEFLFPLFSMNSIIGAIYINKKTIKPIIPISLIKARYKLCDPETVLTSLFKINSDDIL